MRSVADDELEIIPPGASPDLPSLEELDRMARLLDARWAIPGTNIRFGVDALVGLVPGVGDLAASFVSFWIIHQAARHGASKPLIARMVGNVVLDTVVGSVPVAGSVFDVFFKSNKRNMALLRAHVEKRSRHVGQPKPSRFR